MVTSDGFRVLYDFTVTENTKYRHMLIAHKSLSSFAKPVGFMFVRFFLIVLFKILVQKAPLLLPKALHLLFLLKRCCYRFCKEQRGS